MKGDPAPAGRPRPIGAKARSPTASKKEVSPLVQAVAQMDWNLGRLQRLVAARKDSFDFATAGSSGRRPDDLLAALAAPVFRSRMLVDIRAEPTSRHTPDWNQRSIEERARARRIEYVHRPELGVPSEIRRRLATGDLSYGELFEWYDRHVVSGANLEALRPMMTEHPVFLCTELSPTFCHRNRLAAALERAFGLLSFDI
jgi:uncharacterized protein (DUF488 family)